MDPRRLQVALRELPPSEWQKFEQLASTFLVAEYPQLKTLAAPSGDEGLGATLFVPTQSPKVAIQYSITPEWKSKVRATAKKLNANFPGQFTVLLYRHPHHCSGE